MHFTAETMDDHDAITACQNGDGESFGDLVRKYERELMGHALALLGNREDALDTIQEAFVRAFKSIGRFNPERKFYPWLYGIMRNLCVDSFRKRAKDAREKDSFWRSSELNSQLDDPDDRNRLLWDALGKLSQPDREIIVLKHLEGRKYDDISEILKVARGTVMSRLYRARQKLKEWISRLETHSVDGARQP
jgi:RNA polymerase sigma-70 factor (ECF subfamily)